MVRLRLRDGSRERGRLLTRFGPDSGTLSYCRWPALPCTLGSERHVMRPASAVTRVEIHRGSHEKLGAAIGAVLGVPLGFALCGAMIGLFFQRWGPAP